MSPNNLLKVRNTLKGPAERFWDTRQTFNQRPSDASGPVWGGLLYVCLFFVCVLKHTASKCLKYPFKLVTAKRKNIYRFYRLDEKHVTQSNRA